MQLRGQHGLVARDDVPLLSAPMENGRWSSVPLSAARAGQWMRKLCGCEAGSNIGTHSAKVTLLSWSAKFGLPHDCRRILGYHCVNIDRSMVTYSRDAMAEPLRRLNEVIQSVQARRFDPDATRSGYFRTRTGAECRADDTEDSSSSEGSTDDEEPDHSDEERGCDRICAPLADELGKKPQQFVRHNFSRCLHIVRDGQPKILNCGRPITDSFIVQVSAPKLVHAMCNVCFRHSR